MEAVKSFSKITIIETSRVCLFSNTVNKLQLSSSFIVPHDYFQCDAFALTESRD